MANQKINSTNTRLNNLALYLSLLSNKYNLNILDSNEDDTDTIEEENNFSIPVNMVSEENIRDKFIENLKFLIRNSIEYKKWVKCFKLVNTPIVCSVSDEIVTIEVHHHPLTLEDYVNMALNFIYINNLTYTTLLIADIVMRWHYKNIVGACYMRKTKHKRFHDFHDETIPEDRIVWDIDSFMNDDIIKLTIDDYILSKICNYMPKLVNSRNDLFKNIDITKLVNTDFKPPE